MEHFHVEPISPMDTHSGGAHLTLTVGVVFGGVVDEEQVRDAVKKLARAWPTLGSRLRRISSESQTIEALVPGAEHAELSVTFNIIPKCLTEIETLPTRTPTISTQHLARNISLYNHVPPPRLEDYLSSQSPAFHLHVSMLLDATVLALTFPHVVMDAGGASEVMRGLVGVMEGRDVKPLIEEDPWAGVASSAGQGKREAPRGWTAYGLKEFGLAQEVEAKDLKMDGPIQQRTIYFPKAEIEQLKAEAMGQLKEAGTEVPFLSSGDVIVAWLYKQFYGDEQYSPDRASRLLYILDARLRLPTKFPSTHVHLKNGYLVLSGSARPNSLVREMSLGELALMVRWLVEEGSERESIERDVGWKFEKLEGVRVPAPAGERVLFASNWLTFGLGDLDFSGIIRPGSGSGKVLDVYCGMPGIPRCSGVITHRDTDGGVTATFDWGEMNWISGTIAEYAIEKLPPAAEPETGAGNEAEATEEEEKGETRVQFLISWWYRLLSLWH